MPAEPNSILERLRRRGDLLPDEFDACQAHRAAMPTATWHETFGAVIGTASARSARLAQLAESEARRAQGDLEDMHREQPGRYREGPQLGQGGMGRVVSVHDRQLGRSVALKELLPQDESSDGSGSGYTDRFLREARITAQLEHPGIVPVYEQGVREDGTLYFTMKEIRGESLAELLRRSESLRERLALLDVYVDLCQAMAYAHHKGVIHRDLKPSNVMRGRFGETLVVDWGIARVLTDTAQPKTAVVDQTINILPGDSGDTVAGTVIGTPAYMSPEQARGDLDALDARSDVWSLGVILYELLAGGPPFEGTGAEVIKRVRAARVPPLQVRSPAAPPELAAIAHKALRAEPDERYADASALATEVDTWRRGLQVEAYHYTRRERTARFVRRNRVPLSATALVLIVLAVVSTGFVSQILREQRRATTAEAEAVQAGVVAQMRQLVAEAGRQEALGHSAQAVAQLRGAWALADPSLRGGLAGEIHRLGAHSLPHRILDPRPSSVVGHAISADGRVAYVATDSELSRWDLETGKEEVLWTQAGAETLGMFRTSDGFLHAVSPGDSQELVIRSYELDDGSVRRTSSAPGCQEHDHRVLAVSPDGRLLVRVDPEHRAAVWEAASGELVAHLPDNNLDGRAYNATFSPDGRQLALGKRGASPSVTVWHTPTWEALASLHVPATPRHIRLSSDVLAVGGHEYLWTATPGVDDSVRRYETADLNITALALSADGALLGLEKKPCAHSPRNAVPQIVVHATADGTQKWSSAGSNHHQSARPMAFSPDGRWLATVGRRYRVRIYDVGSGALLRHLAGHTYDVERLAFSADASVLLTGSDDGSSRAWSTLGLDGWSRTRQGDDRITALATNHDGTRVAVGDDAGRIGVYDSRSLLPLYLATGLEGAGRVSWMQWPVRASAPVGVWSQTQATTVASLTSDGGIGRSEELTTDTGPTRRIGPQRHMMAPSGARVATTDSASCAVVHELPGRGEPFRICEESSDEGNEGAFLNDELLAVFRHGEDELSIWDVSARSHQTTFQLPVGGIHRLSPSPDATAAFAVGHQTSALFDLATGQQVGSSWQYAEAQNSRVAWSPDGATFAVVGGSRGIVLWDRLGTAQWRDSTESPPREVTFSSDGGSVAVSLIDGVRVYDADTGARVEELETRGSLPIQFTDQGGALVIGGDDGWVQRVPNRPYAADDVPNVSGSWSNLRVCRDGLDLVVVPLAHDDTSIWAPPELCGAATAAIDGPEG